MRGFLLFPAAVQLCDPPIAVPPHAYAPPLSPAAVRLCDVGAAIQEVMESYEVELDGKV